MLKIDNIGFLGGACRVMEGEYLRGYTSTILREPVGVTGQIAPWNLSPNTSRLRAGD